MKRSSAGTSEKRPAGLTVSKFTAPRNRPGRICKGCPNGKEDCYKSCVEYAVEKIAYIAGYTEVRRKRQLNEDLYALGIKHRLKRLNKERRNR